MGGCGKCSHKRTTGPIGDPMNWLQLLIQLEPLVPQIVADFKALMAKHPQLADPAVQQAFIAALAQAAIGADDAAIALIAADQAAHK